jgi:hypothetical protein
VRRLLVIVMLVAVIAPAGQRAAGQNTDDERTGILEIVEPLAAALSESRGDDFMAAFAPEMRDREELYRHLSALIAFAEVTSSITLLRAENGRAQLDWYMEIRARATGSVVERRRDKIAIRVSAGKIQEFAPVDFFRVPRVR